MIELGVDVVRAESRVANGARHEDEVDAWKVRVEGGVLLTQRSATAEIRTARWVEEQI
jgi:hypothetical protein